MSLELTGNLLDGTRIKGVECIGRGKKCPKEGLPSARLLVEDAYVPWWSPAGDEIVFNRFSNNGGISSSQIWTISSAGANAQQITGISGGSYYPLWLPVDEGQYMVYLRGASPSYEFVLYYLITDSEEWVYNVLLWDDPGFSLTPSGTGILYTVYQSSQPLEMWILDLEDESTSFVEEGYGGAISPDGQWIAYTTIDYQLAIAPMSGGPAQLFDWGGMPKWTPDSEHIVFTGVVDESQLDLFVMHRDGSFKKQRPTILTGTILLSSLPTAGTWPIRKGSESLELAASGFWICQLSSRWIDRSPRIPKSLRRPARNPIRTSSTGKSCRLSGPNPTNPSSAFEFTLKESGDVRLEIYDVRGRLIRRVVSDKKPAGDHFVTWSGNDENGQHAAPACVSNLFETGHTGQQAKSQS